MQIIVEVWRAWGLTRKPKQHLVKCWFLFPIKECLSSSHTQKWVWHFIRLYFTEHLKYLIFFLKLIWQFRSSYWLPEKEKERYRPLNRSTGAPRNLVRPTGMMFWGNKFFVGTLSQQLMRIATCRNKCEVKTHFKKKEFLNPVIGKKHNMTK